MVVTLEATTSLASTTITTTVPPPSGDCLKMDSCLTHGSLEGEDSKRHRRTLSPDKILFLKVPTSVMDPLLTPSATSSNSSDPSQQSRDDTEYQSGKRQASNSETPQQAERPVKKARLVLLTPIGPPGQPIKTVRAVHFDLQTTDNGSANVIIQTHVRVYNRVSCEEAANIWWSADEMGEIYAREKSAVSVMSFCCEHYTSQVLSVLKTARATTAAPEGDMEDYPKPSSAVWVASSPARGLERDIVQGFKARKRQVIRKVLESQRVLQTGRHRVTGELPSPELQSQLLSTQYQKWSHPMVRFAQVLAEGDAQVVVDNNKDSASDPGMAPLEAF